MNHQQISIHNDQDMKFILYSYQQPHTAPNLSCSVRHEHYFIQSIRPHMMTSSNGNIFRVTGHLCGEFTGPRWISVPGEFPAQRPVTRSFNVFFDLRLNKRLSEQSWGWWLETLSRPLWRHCNDTMCSDMWYAWSWFRCVSSFNKVDLISY